MELALGILSAIREPGPTLGLWPNSAVSRDDLERKRLLRFDSLCRPGAGQKDVSLSARLSRPPDGLTAEEVVGVEAAVEDTDLGGSGNGALERRRRPFEKDASLGGLAVAWLPVFGLDSFWGVFRGASADCAFPMMVRTVLLCRYCWFHAPSRRIPPASEG